MESLQAERSELKQRVEQYEGAAEALAALPGAELRSLRDRMVANLERVQRAMYFAEFAESHADLVAQAAAAQAAAAKSQADAAEAEKTIAAAAAAVEEREARAAVVVAPTPDPLVEELKQQLEEVCDTIRWAPARESAQPAAETGRCRHCRCRSLSRIWDSLLAVFLSAVLFIYFSVFQSRASAAALALALEASKAAAEEAEQRQAEEAEAEQAKKAQGQLPFFALRIFLC